MMKLRHKNKKAGKGSKGCKRTAKQNGKKAASKVPSAQLIHFNDHVKWEAELKQKRVEEMREKQQAAREQERHRRRTIESYCQDVLRCQKEFEQKEEVLQELNTFPQLDDEATKKAYYKEFCKVVEYSDVILEVLDARDPLGCRCFQMEEAVLQAQGNKKLVLILNKIDLVPKEVVEKWLDYLRNELPTVAFKASTQHQVKNLNRCRVPVEQASESLLKSKACFGAENLMRVLGNYCRLGEVRTHIRVGVVGLPNVGKSSLINSLKRSRACSVGAVPGVTKFMQEVHLDKFIRLLDTPGVVPGPNSEVGTILCNCIHVQKLTDPVTPVETILQRCNLEEISNYYGISGFQTTDHFLTAVAHRLGKKKKGGIYSQEQAAKAVLADWVCGKISFYTPPPPTHTLPAHLSAEIVKEMTEVFDIEDTEQANEDTMECLATGESDELLGDIDPLEMKIKWLHSPMMKIDTIENKTTMYKIGDLAGYYTNPNRHQVGWAKRNVDHHPKNCSMVDVCPVDRRSMLQRIMETDPLQQGQILASALKKKKKMQKRTDKIASKLSDSMMSVLDLSDNTDDSAVIGLITPSTSS
ncbi:guanine nucleotide-binding protein-like 3-like protein isoform X2 [Dasypus novemcinctus]|uniref:guanine nucleotide-binding protein-like 3-like protein isoform X2 n=1 Tax=Dasypus novemcinctus TaxID=9361 RepID=UPI00265F64EF|nr:guanine nucleotide-binding protein-like 3-like protein isoform X2 [Dasypus novemcinctus]XP_058147051.1 guanine nucleotide-binding protein-like 3-like protein isoform X2 [Dasypus novemcinctus]XP_058147052.1 guanine nucleotide-binding protein-like 3-like protein isoform X2 [Dasypus novemcinctus]XP_058147053.1 guanine nucleotide-binding protein-like 3-like protein isoform X2 [Dasypus novemcinctus]